MKKTMFVPATFYVPPSLETGSFRLRMLSVGDVRKDYEAVIESRALLQSMGGTWPRDGFTIAENLADLERHERDFLDRRAFAYTVVSLDEARVLGCVYINPSADDRVDAEVFMWVRQSEFDKGLDAMLLDTVKRWIRTSWPFKVVTYPGRDRPDLMGGSRVQDGGS